MGDADANDKAPPAIDRPERSSSKEKRRIRRDSAKDSSQSNSGAANGPAKKGGKIGDRKSRSIYGRGLPKKQGGGGKGTWGKLGEEVYPDDIDSKDPNYDSEELNKDIMYKPVVPEWNEDEIVKTLQPILREYFEHGQQDEVIESLKGINISGRKYMVAVVLITLSMEMKNEFRELASVLIKKLVQPLPPKEAGDAVSGKRDAGYFQTSDDLSQSFLELCDNLPELTLDTPDAPKVLGKFLARAISDNVIEKNVIEMIFEAAAGNDDEDYGLVSAKEARLLLSIPHYNLGHIWGVGGGNQPVIILKKRINLLLKEYLSSGDSEEAIRCITDLDVPHFSHEVVYEAVVMVIELSDERASNMMVHLFKRLADTAVVSLDQMTHGFKRVYGEMDDLSIDVPNAYAQLRNYVQKCYDLKVINSRLMMTMPNKGRKRFVSEGDRNQFRFGADKFFDLA